MKVLYYQCASGISGDMNLGAMLDLGIDPEYLLKELSFLGLGEEYEIKVRRETRKGIAGTRCEVCLKDHGTNHQGKHQHRTIRDIEKIIGESQLSESIKNRSLRMFHLLADAEAHVHGIDRNQVHFHEVGATDAIVDIVGTAICLEYLQVDKVVASTVELGGGFVSCEHGLLPVPAPAVLELLKGIPVSTGRVEHETTTPTGAVILVANADEFTDQMNLLINKVGYGVGKKDFTIPNVLRILLGTQIPKNEGKGSGLTADAVQYMIETNIDDMNPEFYELAEERLFGAGALDVFKTPIIMKKSRPGIKLSILTAKENLAAVEEILLRDTSAIGLRKYCVEKVILPRTMRTVKTKYGPVSIKTSYLEGKKIKEKPEYHDCRRIAIENNLSLTEVYKEVGKYLEE
ncbi:MAG: nickel pincer cofactor biosynthesis protein LarC [Peptococcaceae bacterium]|nr:nickel pincer cofactor biosynthesis protein LarC [Peptococcaceae bacterium]